jgi:hypothetical protein
MYGIEVKFKQVNGWSKGYTYLYDKAVPVLSIVLVESNTGFYNVGKVSKCIENFEVNNTINYRRLTHIVE